MATGAEDDPRLSRWLLVVDCGGVLCDRVAAESHARAPPGLRRDAKGPWHATINVSNENV
jgi:hypothetical protein